MILCLALQPRRLTEFGAELRKARVGMVPVGQEGRPVCGVDVEETVPALEPKVAVLNRRDQCFRGREPFTVAFSRVRNDDAYTSSPAMSPTAKGPKSARRKPNVLLTTASICSGVATPSSTICTASL